MNAKQNRWITPPDNMGQFHVWCFNCKRKLKDKSEARQKNKNHEVEWIRIKDGVRYIFIPDGQVPKAAFEGGLT